MGLNPKKEAEKAVKRAVDKVAKPATEKVVHEVIEPATKAATGAIWDARSKAWHKITDTGKEAVAGVEKARKEAEDGLKEKLPEMISEVSREIGEELSAQALQRALENAAAIIEMTQPDVYGIVVGIEAALIVQGEVTVTVEIPNPLTKLLTIREWAKSPPKGRAKIIECVDSLVGGASFTAEAKVSGNGGYARWQAEDKLEKLDKFLEHHGID